MKKLLYIGGILISGVCFSQQTDSKIKASFFDGITVAGYVDHGAFINFTGPNVSVKHKDFKFILGMLPSLRIREDKSEGTKNSAITPNLGAGFTVAYKKIALQIPFYYNTKTSTQNGAWKMGIGLGYSFK
ncbi:hypothetical protein SAMN05421664_0383 [Chryseobacterium soldanellicola]|uniref:Outer membrane protein beta-barrel domain-containing protein n=1 Tax=Chryseobacterium soldanellicola TaxID=311333 RepID=A0A1H0XZG7_9FLAO|nr:hypothetical protein [Chryseobacterium soldanellicola]SDQ08260.1 hypothetical protein SAMN05421664_0383 [Chryseobacterium soldanellicola]